MYLWAKKEGKKSALDSHFLPLDLVSWKKICISLYLSSSYHFIHALTFNTNIFDQIFGLYYCLKFDWFRNTILAKIGSGIGTNINLILYFFPEFSMLFGCCRFRVNHTSMLVSHINGNKRFHVLRIYLVFCLIFYSGIENKTQYDHQITWHRQNFFDIFWLNFVFV